jgi:integrase
MLQDMAADVHKLPAAGIPRAVFYRDMLLMALVQANPLRARMWSIMKFDRNLVKEKDGSWWIYFEKKDFKNRWALDSDYQVRLSKSVWGLIDEYREKYRAKFFHASSCDYVFLPSRNSPEIELQDYRISPVAISGIVVQRTFEYIPGCDGFRIHSFRHILATDIIKNDPERGFERASTVLHDSLEMVKSTYSHLKTCEFYEPYNSYFDSTLESLGGIKPLVPPTSSSNSASDGPTSWNKGGWNHV